MGTPVHGSGKGANCRSGTGGRSDDNVTNSWAQWWKLLAKAGRRVYNSLTLSADGSRVALTRGIPISGYRTCIAIFPRDSLLTPRRIGSQFCRRMANVWHSRPDATVVSTRF